MGSGMNKLNDKQQDALAEYIRVCIKDYNVSDWIDEFIRLAGEEKIKKLADELAEQTG